jgi:hypothetical protein
MIMSKVGVERTYVLNDLFLRNFPLYWFVFVVKSTCEMVLVDLFLMALEAKGCRVCSNINKTRNVHNGAVWG